MARYPIKMLLDKDLGPFIPYLPSNAVVVEGSNKTVADQITDLHNEIDERLSTVYDFKGSVTFENLPITGQKTGDVYDITNDFILNDQEYPAGTNLAWATDHWDPLAGMLNIKTVYKKLDLSVAIMPTVSSINGYAFSIEANKAQWLKLINDVVKAGENYVDFVTTQDDGYTFRLFILNTTDGTQNCSMMLYTPLYKLYNLHYGDTYWYNKTVKITFVDRVATDITVQTGSGYSYREWLYPQLRNTTSFTPTADTHLATKKYVDDADALKEALTNKITSLLSTSTDTEYPSAKAVYDFVKNNINMGKLTIPNTQNDAVTLQNLKPGLYMFAETLYAYDYYYYFKYKTTDPATHLGKGVVPILLIVYKDPNTIVVPATGTSEEFALVYTWNNERAGDANSGYIGVKRFALRYNNNEIVIEVNGNPISYGRTIDQNAQEITGTKTFAAIPKQKTTTAPTLDEQFTNKKYVDDTIAKVTTMPTADSTLEGKVYQYVGTTSGSYTKGHFYECVSDGGNPATYSWNEIQFSGGGGGGPVLPIVNCDFSSSSFIMFNTFGSITLGNATDTQNFIDALNYGINNNFKIFIINISSTFAPIQIIVSLQNYDKTSATSSINIYGMLSTNDYLMRVLQYGNNSDGDFINWFAVNVTNASNQVSAITQITAHKDTSHGGYLPVFNTEAYTPTGNYNPATKKYVDDAIKGTDLSQYVELALSNPGVTLSKVRYANIGDSFSLAYIVYTTVDILAASFAVKLPASHYYKTLPSTYTYEPMGAVTYFEYDTQTQSADPKNAYGYLTYNPSDPDYVEIKIYPVDYSGQTGILANSYFYVNCNWIRI